MINREYLPQVQVSAKRGGNQPYLRHNASRNSDLCSKKSCLIKGSTDNQVEAPFSFARSMDRSIVDFFC